MSKSTPPTDKDRETTNFLTEIINSQFNLITDHKVKKKIIEYISEVPSVTVPEKLLKSYLYLMIGNITRSDNLLRSHIQKPPRENWRGFSTKNSLYHRLARDNAEKILVKFSKHPADRRSFELFSLYLENYSNDELLLQAANGLGEGIEDKISLRYVEMISPPFVHYLRLKRMSDERRMRHLRDVKMYPLVEQAFWDWPFMDISPLVSDELYGEVSRLEKEDHVWFIYLMDSEKLTDMYIKNGGKYLLSGQRSYLRSQLNATNPDFMLSLFKLIEIGDIDSNLVSQTLKFLLNE